MLLSTAARHTAYLPAPGAMLGSMEEQQHGCFLLVAMTAIGGPMANCRLLTGHWQLHLSSVQVDGRNCCLRRLLHQFQQNTIDGFMGVPD